MDYRDYSPVAWVLLLIVLGVLVWAYHQVYIRPPVTVADLAPSMQKQVAKQMAAQDARDRMSGRGQYLPSQIPADTDEPVSGRGQAPSTSQASPQVSRCDQRAWEEAQRLAALNAQRRALYYRIQALQAEWKDTYAAQLTAGSQHEEAMKADQQYEEALKRGDWDAKYETPSMRLDRLRPELASCYDQMAGLYQQDDPRYASWCRQVASDIRAQRIP